MALRLRRGTDAERVTITPQAGELIYVIDTKKVYVGDGLTQGGIPIDSTVGALSIGDLTDVDTITTPPENGEALVWNSSDQEWQPQPVVLFESPETDPTVNGNLKVNIVGSDSTLLVDSDNSRLRGILRGDLEGDVFGNNGEQLINATTNTYVGKVTTPDTLTVDREIDVVARGPGLQFNLFRGTIESPLVPQQSDRTSINWNFYNPNTLNYDLGVGIFGYHMDGGGAYLALTAADANYDIFNASIAINGPTSEIYLNGTTEVRGSLDVSAGITGDLTGSVFTDASTVLIDATDGKLMIANINVVGNTGSTPSTPGSVDSWLEVSVNGVTKFIALYS